MIKAVGYCRFSSENQADGFSIEAQKNAINDFAKRNGYSISKFYVDEAKSGTDMNGRPSFLDMLADAKKHEFQVVIVHKLDRFSRSRVDSAISKKILKDNDIRLISVLEQLDDSPESIILESVLEGMNEYYSKNLSRETKKGMKVAGTKGRVLGSIPFGYSKDKDNKFIINEQEAKILKEMFNLYYQGMPLSIIAREFKNKGYKSRNNNDFTPATIKIILSNRNYFGDYFFGKDIYKGVIPIILNPEIVTAVQNKINATKRPVPKDKGATYILTGKLIHSCGSPMVGYKSIRRGKPYYFYRCVKKEPGGFIKKEFIEQAVINAVLDFFDSDKALNDLAQSISNSIKKNNKNTNFSNLNDLEKDLNFQEEKLLDLYLSGNISRELYLRKKEVLDIELNSVKNKLRYYLMSHKFSPKMAKLALEHYKNQIKSSLNDSKELQAALSIAIKEIRLSEDNKSFSISFTFENSRSVALELQHAPPDNFRCAREARYY